MTTAREMYDAMIRERIAPALRERGFRKQRNRFSRPFEGGWHVIDFQASQFGPRDDVRFTINLGAVYPELRRADDAWTERRPPSEAACDIRERIGTLLPGGEDRWWALNAASDRGKLADEIAAVLTDIALPWIEERADVARLLALVRSRTSELTAAELVFLPKPLQDAGYREDAEILRGEEERRRGPR